MFLTASSPVRFAVLGAVTTAAAAALVVAPSAPASPAGGLADSTVTITADGTDLSGTVRSPRRACKDGRLVIVFRQIGTRGGGDDVRFATDNAELRDGVGVWSTGNTGTEGRFYAKVRRTDRCRADASPTVTASR